MDNLKTANNPVNSNYTACKSARNWSTNAWTSLIRAYDGAVNVRQQLKAQLKFWKKSAVFALPCLAFAKSKVE